MLNLSYKAISANCVLKMDSNEINKFAKQFGLNKFLGVFAVDELSLIPETRHGLVIFNTDTSQSVGQHWLALCITKTKIFYFDSLNSVCFSVTTELKFEATSVSWSFSS